MLSHSWRKKRAMNGAPEGCGADESLVLEEGERLQAGDVEGLAAADVKAGELVVAAHHVGLGLGEASAVAFIGVPGKLGALAADYPGDFVLGGLAAFGTGEVVCALLRGLCEKFALFHGDCSGGWLLNEANLIHTRS